MPFFDRHRLLLATFPLNQKIGMVAGLTIDGRGARTACWIGFRASRAGHRDPMAYSPDMRSTHENP